MDFDLERTTAPGGSASQHLQQADEIARWRLIRSHAEAQLLLRGDVCGLPIENMVSRNELIDAIEKARELRSLADPRNPFAMDALMWLERALSDRT